IQKVMTTMISNYEKLFPWAKDTQPSPPPSESSSQKTPVLRSSKENFEVWTKVVRLKKEIEEEKTKSAELESELQNLRRSSKVNKENQPHGGSLESTGQVPTGTEQRTECANQL
ncbi:hypothetical protein E2320_006837, partial [Naja naja]